MLERLYFSDLVLAEMTIPNGNVYYEVGIRHACQGSGCVLLAADWSRQLFDVAQMRTVRYPLAVSEVDEVSAQTVRDVVLKRLPPLVTGSSPVYDVLPGYPAKVDPTRASVMRRQLEVLSEFQMRMSQIRIAPREMREELTTELLTDYSNGAETPPAIAHGLLKLFENLGAWQRILDFVATLPPAMARQANVAELTNLAKSKLGNHIEAIAALETLIRDAGPTSEREGLLGGRYKKLAAQATGNDKQRHLNNAIQHYEAGMMLDLNDYYPSSNLPRLYRQRGYKGDAEKAAATAQAVYFACQRARQRGSADDWLKPTLLGAAFDAGDVDEAEGLYREILQEDPASWKLESTLDDLEVSLQYVSDQSKQVALAKVLQQLRALLK
jgi:tetratricopeptide (TPR) repeat protein